MDENKTIEDYIPLNFLNQALKNLILSNGDYTMFLKDAEFTQDNIDKQIKTFASLINEGMKKSVELNSEPEENIVEEINPGTLKLDLFIKLKDLINEENVNEFTALIEKIKMINNRAKDLYNV